MMKIYILIINGKNQRMRNIHEVVMTMPREDESMKIFCSSSYLQAMNQTSNQLWSKDWSKFNDWWRKFEIIVRVQHQLKQACKPRSSANTLVRYYDPPTY